MRFGYRHTDGVRYTLSQRTGRRFHAGSHSVFRVPGRFRAELTEIFDFRHRQIITEKV